MIAWRLPKRGEQEEDQEDQEEQEEQEEEEGEGGTEWYQQLISKCNKKTKVTEVHKKTGLTCDVPCSFCLPKTENDDMVDTQIFGSSVLPKNSEKQ